MKNIGTDHKKSRKRICFLLPGFTSQLPGGYKIFYEYAKGLMELGYQVEIIHPAVHRPIGQRFSLLRRLYYFFVYPLAFFGFSPRQLRFKTELTRLVGNLPWVKQLPVRQIPYLHPRYFKSGSILVFSDWQSAHIISGDYFQQFEKYYFVQGYEDWSGPKDLVEATYQNPYFQLITISDDLAYRLQLLGRKDIPVILNGINPIFFEKQKVFQSQSPRPLKIGFVYAPGNTNKNTSFIFEIMDSLKDLDLQWCGVHRSPVVCDLAIHFYQAGNDAQMAAFYKDIDLFLFPSISEGFGLPVVESMASGTPVLSNQTGIATNLIQHGTNSYCLELELSKWEKIIRDHYELGIFQQEKLSHSARAATLKFKWDKQFIDFLIQIGMLEEQNEL